MKEERQKIRFLLSGCWKILDGNIWERVTEKEYAVNEGKVSKDKDKAKDKDKHKHKPIQLHGSI